MQFTREKCFFYFYFVTEITCYLQVQCVSCSLIYCVHIMVLQIECMNSANKEILEL